MVEVGDRTNVEYQKCRHHAQFISLFLCGKNIIASWIPLFCFYWHFSDRCCCLGAFLPRGGGSGRSSQKLTLISREQTATHVLLHSCPTVSPTYIPPRGDGVDEDGMWWLVTSTQIHGNVRIQFEIHKCFILTMLCYFSYFSVKSSLECFMHEICNFLKLFLWQASVCPSSVRPPCTVCLTGSLSSSSSFPVVSILESSSSSSCQSLSRRTGLGLL